MVSDRLTRDSFVTWVVDRIVNSLGMTVICSAGTPAATAAAFKEWLTANHAIGIA